MSKDSICFKEAYDLRIEGRIQLEEYLKHIVAHYEGKRHDTDAEGNLPFLYAGFENEVRKIVLGRDFAPLTKNETALVYSIFASAFHGAFAAVQDSLRRASKLVPETYLSPLVEIAQETGDARVLRLCLGLGHTPTGYNECNRILDCRTANTPTTEWLNVLYEFDFRQWCTDQQQLNQWDTWHYVLNMGPDCTRWWIDHGGRTPSARGLFSHYQPRWPGAPAFRILLDRFGIEWFANSGTLQLAVKKPDFETVQMLLDAGADVNEDVEDWNLDVREHRAAPLPALHTAVYAKSDKMIRYLVDRGARMARKDVEDPYNLTPQEFKVFEQLVVDLGGVE